VENQIATSGYIIDFYNNIEALIIEAANYYNVIVENAGKKKSQKDGYQLDDGDKLVLNQIYQRLRILVFKIYTKSEALKDKFPAVAEYAVKMKDAYTYFKDNPYPEVEKVTAYTIEANRFFVTGIMAEMLIQSEALLKGLTSTNV
jgi:hypothetical protein